MNLTGKAPCFYPQLAKEAGAVEHVMEFGPLGHVAAWGITDEGALTRLMVVQRRQPRALLVIDALYTSKSAARTFIHQLREKLNRGELEKWLDSLGNVSIERTSD